MATIMRTKANAATRLNRLEQEMKLLRSLIFNLTNRDPKDEYRPEFIRRYQRAQRDATRGKIRKISSLDLIDALPEDSIDYYEHPERIKRALKQARKLYPPLKR
jgi:hypothetical protein